MAPIFEAVPRFLFDISSIARPSSSERVDPEPQLLHLLDVEDPAAVKGPSGLLHAVCDARPLDGLRGNGAARQQTLALGAVVRAAGGQGT